MGETLGFNADACRPLAEVSRSTGYSARRQRSRRTAHNPSTYGSVGGSGRVGPSTSMLDCLGHDRHVKAKPHAVASRVLTQRPRPEGWQLSRRTGEDQGTAISAGRTAIGRAISGPLTPGDDSHGHSRTPQTAGQAS
jgi:hypothetical protein